MANTIDTTSPHINAYDPNSINLNTVDKLTGNAAVEKVSSNPASPTVPETLKVHERELSQVISNSITGIALANVAQSSLNQQKDLLVELKDIMESSPEITNSTEKKINNLLERFESITEETTFNGEKLLQTDDDTSDDLSIVGEDKIVSIYKVDTTSISNNLRTLLGSVTADPSIQENVTSTLNQNIDELANFAQDFNNASNLLETSVKEKLTATKNSVDEKLTVPQIDYSKEVTDFNKTNLLAPAGYLVQTQANAHTNRTVDILK